MINGKENLKSKLTFKFSGGWEDKNIFKRS